MYRLNIFKLLLVRDSQTVPLYEIPCILALMLYLIRKSYSWSFVSHKNYSYKYRQFLVNLIFSITNFTRTRSLNEDIFVIGNLIVFRSTTLRSIRGRHLFHLHGVFVSICCKVNIDRRLLIIERTRILLICIAPDVFVSQQARAIFREARDLGTLRYVYVKFSIKWNIL